MACSVNSYAAARAARCSTSLQWLPRHSHQPPRQWRSVGVLPRVNLAATSARATSIGAFGGGSTIGSSASGAGIGGAVLAVIGTTLLVAAPLWEFSDDTGT